MIWKSSSPFGTGFGGALGRTSAATSFSTGQLASTSPNAFDVNGYYNKIYTPMASVINKQTDRDKSLMDTQLANQGLAIGSEAYKNAQNIAAENKNDALTRAQSQAYGQALNASQNAFGQALAS